MSPTGDSPTTRPAPMLAATSRRFSRTCGRTPVSANHRPPLPHGGDGLPPPGSVLTRDYRGKSIVVTVLPNFERYKPVLYVEAQSNTQLAMLKRLLTPFGYSVYRGS